MNDLSERSGGFAVMVNGWLLIARSARKKPEVVGGGDRPCHHAQLPALPRRPCAAKPTPTAKFHAAAVTPDVLPQPQPDRENSDGTAARAGSVDHRSQKMAINPLTQNVSRSVMQPSYEVAAR